MNSTQGCTSQSDRSGLMRISANDFCKISVHFANNDKNNHNNNNTTIIIIIILANAASTSCAQMTMETKDHAEREQESSNENGYGNGNDTQEVVRSDADADAEEMELDIDEIEEGSDDNTDDDDEDDDDEDGMIETNVDLGYCEPLQADVLKRLTRAFFPSKVGGVPAWLIPEHLPSENHFKCNRCGEWMTFLCQLYAPIRQAANSNAFHRSLYFFICQSLTCLKSENAAISSSTAVNTPNIMCFRSQLPLHNEYYPSNPPPKSPKISSSANSSSSSTFKADFYEQPNFTNVHLCAICGIPASSSCAACGSVRYCSKDHQTAHWKSEHKQTCTQQKSSSPTAASPSVVESISTLSLESKSNTDLYNPPEVTESTRALRQSILFPVYSIVIDAEELENDDDYSRENELLKDYEKRKKEELENGDNEDDDDGLGRLAPREKDLQFRRFRKRVSANPSQVIRFERNGEPLWLQTGHQCSLQSVPVCEHCGSNRVFECQLMPQLLYYISSPSQDTLQSSTSATPEAYLNAPSLDWGTIALYTCSASCTPSSTSYTTEYVYVQPHYG